MNYEEWWEGFVAEHDDWKYADSEALRRAAFQAGAASRDAEIARLKAIPVRYRRMAFNAQLQDEVTMLEQENDQLREQVKMLREALRDCAYDESGFCINPDAAEALAATADLDGLILCNAEPYAYAIVMPDRADIELVHDLDDAEELLTNNRCEVVRLFAAAKEERK